MARPPLPLGTWGDIRVYPAARGSDGAPPGYRARTLYRGYDGAVREITRRGTSKAKATARLKEALNELASQTSKDDLRGTDRFGKALDFWLERLADLVSDGRRSPGSLDTYRRVTQKHILSAFGELRLVEISTPLVDRFLRGVKTKTGAPTARTCRSILSGVMGLAVRYGAIAHNPVREVEAIEARPRKVPRALDAGEPAAFLAMLRRDPKAVERDLPDLVCFMLATGVRIGEALAVLWSEVDLDSGIVEITSTILRVKGVGLIRKPTKSRAGARTLLLPSWAVDVLRQRGQSRPGQVLFPHSRGDGFRDPYNTLRTIREARGTEWGWLTSHVFRKTAATTLDDAGLSARVAADQLGHARPSLTQDVYFARSRVHPRAAEALEGLLGERSKDGS
jgi:integrase